MFLFVTIGFAVNKFREYYRKICLKWLLPVFHLCAFEKSNCISVFIKYRKKIDKTNVQLIVHVILDYHFVIMRMELSKDKWIYLKMLFEKF